MIDIDLSTLAEAIHGAPPPAPRALARLLRQLGIATPCHAVATYADGLPAGVRRRLRNSAVPVLDRLHPGMVYAFPTIPAQAVAPLTTAGLLVGEAAPIAKADGFLRAVQRAIVTLRAEELARHRASGTEPDDSAERAARDQALQELRLHGDLAATELWLELCLYRHRDRLAAARRRLIEFLALITAELETAQGLDHAFRRGVVLVQATYAFPDLRTRFPEVVAELLPYCHRGSGRRSQLVAETLALMEARHGDPIALADLAAALHVSGEHLTRQFKRETGRGVTEQLHALRVASAKRLLAETDDGVLQVALACGFPSVEHFHRIFKRLTGTTPRKWRLAQG